MVRALISPPAKIAGGFVLIPVAALMHAWRVCQSRPLGIADFRAWLAAHEMVERRCRIHESRDRSPTFPFAELAILLEVTERRARASVKRLAADGLIEWSESAIVFPATSEDTPLDTIGGGRGSIAIPRRMLRFLARGARPALIATALGLLLRCLSRRRSGWDGWGRVKASWVARTFGVSIRQAKTARRDLVSLGWITPDPSDQWAENRHGRAFRIDLGWTVPTTSDGLISSPLPAESGPGSSPPDLDLDPLPERNKNQEPGPAGPAGDWLDEVVEKPGTLDEPSPVMLIAAQASPGECSVERPAATSTASLPAPRLDDVGVEDLKDTERTLELYRQAMTRGLVGSSENDRLKVVAAAEHAVSIGKKNPAGLFAHLIRNQAWRYLTQADEDRANTRLKTWRRGPEPSLTRPQAVRRPVLSHDALIVREIRAALIRSGIYRDPWLAFQAKNPAWDRGRWDAALRELGLG